MRKVVLAAVAGLSMTSAALPADMTLSPTLDSQQVELGSGWYIRGDVGDALITVPGVNAISITAPPPGNAGTSISPTFNGTKSGNVITFGAGFGYQVTPWFRMDATFDHFNPITSNFGARVVCPYASVGIHANDAAQTPLGVLYNTNDTCDGNIQVKNMNNVALVNAYYDLPLWGGFAPYIGAGAGLNFFTSTGQLAYNKTSDGTTYAANLTLPGGYPAVWVDAGGNAITPQPNISYAAQNWNRTLTQTKVTMAIALMAGITYHINEWIALDLGYRYVNADVGNFGSNYSNEFRAGIRVYAN